MQLKIGELARRTGLTVRALHHYDDIGLLKPSARSDGGYRLYAQEDLAKLYRVQVLQRLDVSLTEIGSILNNNPDELCHVVTQQLSSLDDEIRQATALRTHLADLQNQLKTSEQPTVDDWLVALEIMVTSSKYFNDDELARLKAHRGASAQGVRHEKAEMSCVLKKIDPCRCLARKPRGGCLSAPLD